MKIREIMMTSLLGTYLFLFITLLAKLTEQNIVPLEAAFQGKLNRYPIISKNFQKTEIIDLSTIGKTDLQFTIK